MLTWLGAACLAATVPLSGVVVDADGQPAAGVSVLLADTHADNKGPEVLAKTETDDQGQFRLDRPDDLKGRGEATWSPTLWAHKPGFRLVHRQFKLGPPSADESVRLELGPPSSFSVRVFSADGSPSVGTLVQPTMMNWPVFQAPRPPKELLESLAATTDAEGRVSLDGFIPEELSALNVTVKGQLVQTLPFSPEVKTLAPRPLGRLSVRIVGDDPNAPLKGWEIKVYTRPADPNYAGPSTHWRSLTTNDDGRADFEPMAEGRVTWTLTPPEGSAYVAARPPAATIREGETTEAEIRVLRGVRVEGVIRLAPDGDPVPGVKVSVSSFESAAQSSIRVETDAKGRFSALVPPGRGRVSYSSFELPKDYRALPGPRSWVNFTTTGDEERFEVKPPELWRAVRIAGQVVDEGGEPVIGAKVKGFWRALNPGSNDGPPTWDQDDTDDQGRFELGGVDPGVEVTISASIGKARESAPLIIPKAGEGGPIVVRLKKKPTNGLSGRILDAEGNPLAGALVQIRFRGVDQEPHVGSGVFVFDQGGPIRTDADGRFQTPDQIPTDLVRQIEASAVGWSVGHSRRLDPTDLEAPDVRLGRAIGSRELTGRVVDSFGNPIAGALVFQSTRDPAWQQSETNAEGRFNLPNVPNAPALIFASKDDYRFLGRRVEPGEHSVELVLRSFAEPPSPPLRASPSPISREEERAIGRELIAALRQNPEPGTRNPDNPIDVAEAGVDPDRVITMIENQARAPVAALLEALALSRSAGDPQAMLELLNAIDDPGTASTVALNLFDRLGSAARPEFRRELLDWAELRAREIEAPGSPVNQLIQIGERWFDLGDADRGASMIREAQKLVDEMEPNRVAVNQVALVKALSRIDLPEALKRWKDDPNWRTHGDWFRIAAAERLAATDLDEALRFLDPLKDHQLQTARRAVRFRLAKTNLENARSLGAGDDPLTDALLPAIAAKAKASTDPDAARALLRESVDRLSEMATGRPGEPSPVVMLARLLPLANRVDPDRAPAYLWLALARRPAAPGIPVSEPQAPLTPSATQYHLDMAELAALVARYDREAAKVVFAPVADRLGNIEEGDNWGLGDNGVAAIAAAAAYNARAAKAIIDALPDDPPPPKPGEARIHRRDKTQALTAAVRILGLPPALRLRGSLLPNRPTNDWIAAIEE